MRHRGGITALCLSRKAAQDQSPWRKPWVRVADGPAARRRKTNPCSEYGFGRETDFLPGSFRIVTTGYIISKASEEKSWLMNYQLCRMTTQLWNP